MQQTEARVASLALGGPITAELLCFFKKPFLLRLLVPLISSDLAPIRYTGGEMPHGITCDVQSGSRQHNT